MRIKLGDLVYVARGVPCCGSLTGMEGTVFVTTTSRETLPYEECIGCGKVTYDTYWFGARNGLGVAESRLEKFIPPSVEDSVETAEKVTA